MTEHRTEPATPIDDRGCQAAYLIGCHRSGTTLLRYLLDAHSQIACPPESKFLAGIDAFFGYPQVLPALHSLGVTNENVREACRAIVTGVMGAYCRRERKRRWIDKTPNYYRLLPMIEAIFGSSASFVFLVRHPLDTIQSLREFAPFAADCPEDPDIAALYSKRGRSDESFAWYWTEVTSRLLDFNVQHPANSLILKYEDLVAQPRSSLARVLAHLGEEFEEEMLTAAFFPCRRRAGYGDFKAAMSRSIRGDSVDRWHTWPEESIRALWLPVKETASRLGYSIDGQGGMPR